MAPSRVSRCIVGPQPTPDPLRLAPIGVVVVRCRVRGLHLRVDDSKWQAMDWGDLEYLTGESIQVPQVDCAEDMSMSTLFCLGT